MQLLPIEVLTSLCFYALSALVDCYWMILHFRILFLSFPGRRTQMCASRQQRLAIVWAVCAPYNSCCSRGAARRLDISDALFLFDLIWFAFTITADAEDHCFFRRFRFGGRGGGALFLWQWSVSIAYSAYCWYGFRDVGMRWVVFHYVYLFVSSLAGILHLLSTHWLFLTRHVRLHIESE